MFNPYRRPEQFASPDAAPNVLLDSPQWQQMPQQEPIDFGPAAGAFRERFMKPSQTKPAAVGAPQMKPAVAAPNQFAAPSALAATGGAADPQATGAMKSL